MLPQSLIQPVRVGDAMHLDQPIPNYWQPDPIEIFVLSLTPYLAGQRAQQTVR